VMSLFTEWDTDGSGDVDKKEFRKAMRSLGLSAPAHQIDGIFDEFDEDRGGRVEFKELHRLLRQGSTFSVANIRRERSPDRTMPGGKPRPGSAAPGVPGSPSQPQRTPAANRPSSAHVGGPPPSLGRLPSEMVEADDVAAEYEEEAFDVGMRQNAMDYDAADVNQDSKLSFDEFSAMIREREDGVHTHAELKARFESIDENGNNRIDLDEFIRYSLRDALQRSAARVIDLFREWDEDGDGSVSKKEFGKALKALGFEATKEEISGVFDEMDVDKSGTIEYKELNKKMRSGAGSTLDPALLPGAAGEIATNSKGKHALRRGKAAGKKGAALAPSVKLEPSADKPVVEQLREILTTNAVRIIDLFRDWDDDGNGMIDKKEFRKAIAALGYTAPKSDVNAIFDSMDKDKSGQIEYNELNKALRSGGNVELAPELRAGAVGPIETGASLRSPPKQRSTGGGGLMGSMAADISRQGGGGMA